MRSRFSKYQAVLQFTKACGISTGTAVRIRGVTVGSVIRLNPSLKSKDAVIEVEDDKIFIPWNSLIQVNQSGILMETMIDITISPLRIRFPRLQWGHLIQNALKKV
ncbi:hypothetical protein MKX03_032134 [Papaver bracteatum]|nr:hypothetical protein MKX03_032134 [Papaver bracteatum]